MPDKEDSKHKSFTLTVDKLITILLVAIVLTAGVLGFVLVSLKSNVTVLQTKIERLEGYEIKINDLNQKATILHEKIKRLEDTDMEWDEFKKELVKEAIIK